MLTIFALPKPFEGHIDIIQRNAIGTWSRLHPKCQILLFGDEDGTAGVAREFGARHVRKIGKNEFGTPLLNDLFEKAAELANFDLMCYVNSDILLFNDFTVAIDRIHQWRKDFLMVGKCSNLDFGKSLTFDSDNWEEELRHLVRREGEDRGAWGIDYFVFPMGLYKQIPTFALGRAYFDNWLIWKAIAQKAPVVDATRSVMAIHQNHDYSHVSGGRDWAYRGTEVIRNTNLGGGISRRYCILDATHYLGSSGLKRNFKNKLKWEMVKIWKKRLWYLMLDSTRPIRHSLGLRLSILKACKSIFSRRKADL